MITMTKIAELTGVSQSTVSRVLNGNQNVDPATRERVLKCAKDYNYQFNALAQSLQGGKTHLLGVVLSNISNMFFTELAQSIENKARSLGYSIILINTDGDPEKQRDYLDIVRKYRVDGLIMVPLVKDKEVWRECIEKIDVPTAMISREIEGFDSFYLDHEAASKEIAKYLYDKGYEKFLFLGTATDQKYKSFSESLLELGVSPEMIKNDFSKTDEEMYRFLKKELAGEERVGIFARNDLCAIRAIDSLRLLGVEIPERAGVFGFDNIKIGKYLRPRLTTVSQPVSEMVDRAVTRLIERIDTEEDLSPINEKFKATLIPRESA